MTLSEADSRWHRPAGRVVTGEEPEAGRHVPGQPDMWAFALFELLVFAAYFAVYLINRSQETSLYLRSQEELDFPFAVFNTIMMLTSSWSIARCALATRRQDYRSALTYTWLTVLFGSLFLVSKVIGWIHLGNEGFGVTTNEFFTYYWFFTGIHFLHLLIGFVALGVIVYQLRSSSRRSLELVETSAVYWHTVDLLWVLIFSLLYVVR